MLKVIEALRLAVPILTSPRSVEFATSLVSQWEVRGHLSPRQWQFVPVSLKKTGLDPADFSSDVSHAQPSGDFAMSDRIKLTTEQRRAAAVAKLQSDLDWVAANQGSPVAAALLARVNGLIHATVLRLCILVSSALGRALGDSGPLSVDVLRQVAVARLCAVGPEEREALFAKALAGQKAPGRSKRVAVDPVLPPVYTPVPSPVSVAVNTVPVVEVPVASPIVGVRITEVTEAPSVSVTADPVAPIVVPETAEVRLSKGEKLAADFAYWQARCPAIQANPGGVWAKASDVFGLSGVKGWVETFHHVECGAPAIDPDYILNAERVQEMVDNMSGRVPTYTWTWGERGVGKTSFAEQLAARLGRPFVCVTFDRFTDPAQIIGDMGLEAGNTGWQDGSILRAVRPGTPPVILLDELSQAVADSITGPLNAILDGGCCYTVPKTGEVIRFDKRTMFLAGDNTNGTGDPTGRFIGARPQNAATRDRFGACIQMMFAPKNEEVKIISKRAECDREIALKAWGVMNVLRQKCNGGELADPPSLRECIAFAKKLRTGMVAAAAAFDRTFAQKAPVDAQETMRQAFLAFWGAGDPLVEDVAEPAAV